MKLIALVTLFTLSAPVFAQTCYVDMVDRYNRVVRTFIGQGDPNVCFEGMKECRKALRMEPHLGGVDCIREARRPVPQPVPQPQPQPTPYPSPDQNYPYEIISGETIFNVSNQRYAQVVARDYGGKFVLRYNDNGATGGGWDREDLAPLRGCDYDICVNDQVYNVNNNRSAVVAGLQMVNRFVLKFSDNGASGSGWDRSDIAVRQGCQSGVCVGQRVYNVYNSRYATVYALQVSNKFVLKFSDNGATGGGWDLSDLAPVR